MNATEVNSLALALSDECPALFANLATDDELTLSQQAADILLGLLLLGVSLPVLLLGEEVFRFLLFGAGGVVGLVLGLSATTTALEIQDEVAGETTACAVLVLVRHSATARPLCTQHPPASARP